MDCVTAMGFTPSCCAKASSLVACDRGHRLAVDSRYCGGAVHNLIEARVETWAVGVWGCILGGDGKSFSLLIHPASDSLARLFCHVSGSLTGTVLV